MGDRTEKIAISKVGLGLLKVLAAGGVVGLAILAPNSLKMLDKPLRRYFSNLDGRAQRQELRRGLYYLNRQGWASKAGATYEHGMRITRKGQVWLQAADLANLTIAEPARWDKQWRLVFYDIPEKHKLGRDALVRQLKKLGFYQLQRSVFVHPFPCRKEIELVAGTYKIESFVSYIVTEHIDQQDLLFKRFPFLK